MASGDGVEVIVAQRLIKGIAHVDASNVAVARPSQIVSTNVVRMNCAVHHRAHRLRTNQKTVVVVVNTGVVMVVVEAEFGRVTLSEKILTSK